MKITLQIQIESTDVIESAKILTSLQALQTHPEEKSKTNTKSNNVPKEDLPKPKRAPSMCHKQCEICKEFFDTPAHGVKKCDKCKDLKSANQSQQPIPEILPEEQSVEPIPPTIKEKRLLPIIIKKCSVCHSDFETRAYRTEKCDKCKGIKSPILKNWSQNLNQANPIPDTLISKSFEHDVVVAPPVDKIVRSYNVDSEEIIRKLNAGTLQTRPTKKEEISSE